MKVFMSAVFDPKKKSVISGPHSGMWTIKYARRPVYDYFKKPESAATSTRSKT